MVLKAKLERCSMRRKVECQGTREKTKSVSSRQTTKLYMYLYEAFKKAIDSDYVYV